MRRLSSALIISQSVSQDMFFYIYTSSARSGFARMKLENLNRAYIVEYCTDQFFYVSARPVDNLAQPVSKTEIPGPARPA